MSNRNRSSTIRLQTVLGLLVAMEWLGDRCSMPDTSAIMNDCSNVVSAIARACSGEEDGVRADVFFCLIMKY